jgi:hypothetical protein
MDGYAQLLNAKYVILWKGDGAEAVLIPRDLAALRANVARLEKQYEQQSKMVEEVRAATGRDPVLTARRLTLVKLEGELRDAREALARTKQEVASADKLSKPEDFARVDEWAKDLLRRREELRGQIDDLQAQLGPDAGPVRTLQLRLERTDAQWREYTSDLTKRFYVHWDSSGKGPLLVPRDQGPLESKVERLAQEVEEVRKQLEPGKAR